MGSASKFRQDLPPAGGYAKILVERTFPKTWLNWKRIAVIFVGLNVFNVLQYKYRKMQRTRNFVEDNDVRVALDPFLKSERDRLWLQTLSRLRDEENEVMKDVPGWKTGTWYGEPIYFTIPPDKWWDPMPQELHTHSRWIDQWNDYYFKRQQFKSQPFAWDKYMPDFLWDLAP